MPLTTRHLARKKKAFWQSLVPEGVQTRIHVAGIVTEETNVSDAFLGLDEKPENAAFLAMKMFIRSVSNSAGADVDNIDKVIPLIKAMSDIKLFKRRKQVPVLKIHAERKFTLLGRRISFLDRERVAVERDVERILQVVPNAVIEICHVSLASTIEAIDYYQSKGYRVYGEIAPHYSEYVVDDLFEDGTGGTGLNANCFCLPIFKTPADRMAVHGAMTSGKSYFHFGDDEACHNNDPTQEKGVKTNRHGISVGGQTQIPEAVVSYVIEQFIEARRPITFAQAFLSDNARKLYGLPAGTRVTRFVRQDWVVPDYIERTFPNGKVVRCRVAMGGQTRKYKLPD